MNTALLAMGPLINVGGSLVLSWLLTLALIAAIVLFVVWVTKQFAGPPVLPEWAKVVIWILVAIALLIFIFAALGIHLP